ncbi:hypothetical protein LAUMK35_00472 [Mycobacterium pseudokansasii]|uniref:Uncharacterized protein n=1 Tax=Mycobacterium pseudokansasii TaxID=2341080 RepID=A0A498QL43_9MYCO|nr:hypothetical protein LAUMK35_00472 [Mycobacterium pseudokansasii]VAZ88557.1 hypothetical protein LAUMK21_00472 [Mycobacterium pseudokansasii]VBA46408.1 hypothetical protein LAUMK142_00326 [Mycobacterium pseudokansasii]
MRTEFGSRKIPRPGPGTVCLCSLCGVLVALVLRSLLLVTPVLSTGRVLTFFHIHSSA